MDVLGDVCWGVIVDHVGHVLDIDTSSHDIGANKDVCVAVAKRVKSLFSLLLRLFAVD